MTFTYYTRTTFVAGKAGKIGKLYKSICVPFHETTYTSKKGLNSLAALILVNEWNRQAKKITPFHVYTL
jgi:hypothetical protein